MTALVLIPAVFFITLGVVAIRRPDELLRGFGIVAETVDARNEIRAVYGGFPLALGLTLCGAALVRSDLSTGIVATAAAATLGMSAGRLISAGIDRRFGPLPLVFTAVELAIAGMLMAMLVVEAGA